MDTKVDYIIYLYFIVQWPADRIRKAMLDK